MKKIIVASLCCFSSLMAIPESDFGLGVGYRQNEIHTQVFSPYASSCLSYEENYDKIRVPFVSASANFFFSLFFMRLDATAGFFDHGRVKIDDTLPLDSSTIHFKADTEGVQYTGNIKIEVPLLMKRQGLSFAPNIGYSADYQKFRKVNPQPDPLILENIFPFSTLQTSINPSIERTKILWHGPYVGLDLVMRTSNRFFINLGYAYHLLWQLQEMDLKTTYLGTDSSSTILLNAAVSTNRKLRSELTEGHSGEAKLILILSKNAKLNLSARYITYRTGKVSGAETRRSTQIIPSPCIQKKKKRSKFSSTYDSLSFLAEITRQF